MFSQIYINSVNKSLHCIINLIVLLLHVLLSFKFCSVIAQMSLPILLDPGLWVSFCGDKIILICQLSFTTAELF